jgi:N6-L-threonylcarbamoyladenine synthase
MIGSQGYYEYLSGNIADQSLNAYATKSFEGEQL